MENRLLSTTKDVAECAIFTAIMVVTSFISIPFYPVPISLQTFTAILCGLISGAKKGAIAMTIYAVLGLIGIPVFADHSAAGIAYVSKPSFGYIIGFIAAAIVGGVISSKNAERKFSKYLVAAFAALGANYVIGIVYFALIWVFVYNGLSNLIYALGVYNLLYLPKDVLLSVFAAFIAQKAIPLIRKN